MSRKWIRGSRRKCFMMLEETAGTASLPSQLPPAGWSGELSALQLMEIFDRVFFQLTGSLARHLLDELFPHLFAHGLELQLLLRIKERLDLFVEGDANFPQTLDLLQATE